MTTAWFLRHRIRAAMASGDLSVFGEGGGIVEVDETSIGRIKGAPKKRAFHHKMKVLALIDRNTGQAHTMVVDDVTGLCCKTDAGDSPRESSGIDGRDGQTCFPFISHDELA